MNKETLKGINNKVRDLYENPFLRFGIIIFILILLLSFWRVNRPKNLHINYLPRADASPYLVQGQQNKELPEMSLTQNNSLLAISSPEVVNIRSLASLGSEVDTSDDGRDGVIEYSVKSGDTISLLSQKFGISPNTIYWANSLNKRSSLEIGQKLIILPVSGIIYHVREGDTLSGIAKIYKADVNKTIAYNDLSNDKIYPSDVLIIPDAQMPVYKVPSFRYSFSNVSLPKSYFICPIPLTNGKCLVTQNLHYFNAVDLSTPGISCGKPVRAAAQGTIIQTKYGYNHCYGNFVKILHSDGLVTLYAHLQTILVQPGQKVYRGQAIGYIGHTGRTIPVGPRGCHLHFEVRSTKGTPPRNPFAF